MNQDSKSHATQRKEKSLEIKAAICEILEWTEQEFCNFQYEQGLVYLEEYAKQNFITAFQAFLLERSPLFWNWHRNAWTQRDEWLLNSFCSFKDGVKYPSIEALSVSERRAFYENRHNGTRLVFYFRPGRIILESIKEAVA